jgi:hypothetical protein
VTPELFACIGILLLLGALNYTHNIDHKEIMTALANVQTAELDLIAKTEALLAHAVAQDALIGQLQVTIAAGGMDPTTAQAVQAVADAMTAESAKVAAFLAPPVAQPTV